MKVASLMALGLLVLAGCSRKPCTDKNTSHRTPPPGSPMAASMDLVSPKMTVCNCTDNFVTGEFAKGENPFVTVTNELEGKGFVRTSQDNERADFQTIRFKKDDRKVNVVCSRENGGYWTVSYTLEK